MFERMVDEAQITYGDECFLLDVMEPVLVGYVEQSPSTKTQFSSSRPYQMSTEVSP